MNEPPSPDEQFMNLNNDEVITYIGLEDGEHQFTRPSEGVLSIPTGLWYDDDIDWFESMGVRA